MAGSAADQKALLGFKATAEASRVIIVGSVLPRGSALSSEPGESI